MVAVELEVLAKKFDRFGWDRDRGSMAHDRAITDWMDALHDYPLDEIQAASKSAVIKRPNHMPNEGHIIAAIMEARAVKIRQAHQQKPEPEAPPREQMTPERRAAILEEFGRDNDAAQIRQFSDKATEVV